MGTTIGMLIEDAVRTLVDTGTVIGPRPDAEALAVHLFGAGPAGSERDGVPGDREAARYLELVARRAAGVPLGHLTGVAELAGVEVAVGPGVFVPRAQSESMLAEGLRAIEGVDRPLAVDLCTGSAAIALALAHHRPRATVHAVDCDPVALEFARANSARRAALGDPPIELHQADVFAPGLLAELDGAVDLVVTNPPFMPEGAEVPAEFGVYQPHRAVFGGPDGLHVIRQVVELAARLLRPGGTLVVEHGHLHASAVPGLLGGDPRYTDVSARPDQYGWPLYAVARRGGPGPAAGS
ncbi:N5-glutamine methyltransferase family protein [Kitasatospora sp. NPDC003701]